ncbi:MAG: Tab2/Atab2 family RNA-binding protein [Thermosynechococcus sp. Uc]|uniref:Tab2/Atab2 family RNA-binding protein n=1 Tax=Thermosynechococcus sp. Uc TaxID=3034853 RepID=UPI001A03D47D|nr:Tab2/Atab2 family RNA-binding protein [Thermosynechococcus sp. Uc]MDM7325537.1 Tab2/Atab2 family RNA-binding protein [Thermosynechococcus sp. Uc]HIK25530.1 Tab2/Atab2 family RNA-binding protein [Thermosynechococcus sp. M46_R2017_013]
MDTIWELDFYSRPLVDENNKKIWELLICDRQQHFQFSKTCAGAEANARWLTAALEEAMDQWRQQLGLADGVQPERVRFFRRAMASIITRGGEAAGLVMVPSRRTFALYNWLRDRALNLYPTLANYQADLATPPQLIPPAPQPLPPALRGDRWQFSGLALREMKTAAEWELPFGEVPPLPFLTLSEDTLLPGLIIYSQRALPLAGWLSGLEPAYLSFEEKPQPLLVLETGASDRWVLISGRNPQIQKELATFRDACTQNQGLHFIAVKERPEQEALQGFWLLQQPPEV